MELEGDSRWMGEAGEYQDYHLDPVKIFQSYKRAVKTPDIFVKHFPEEESVKLEGLWQELPGSGLGRIGFLEMLSSIGAWANLRNDRIWFHPWMQSRQRLILYDGGGNGLAEIEADEYWYQMQEDFRILVAQEAVADVIGMHGRFDLRSYYESLKIQKKKLDPFDGFLSISINGDGC